MISEYCGDDKSSLSIGLDDSLKALKKTIMGFVGNMFYCLELNVSGDCEEKQDIVQIEYIC